MQNYRPTHEQTNILLDQLQKHFFSHITCTGGGGGILLLKWGGGGQWPSGLERWTGDRTVRGSNPTAENFSLRNFGNSVYPALPVSFGGDTKSRRSLLSGVYARGSKRSHQSALECVTVVDSTAGLEIRGILVANATMFSHLLPAFSCGSKHLLLP